MTAPPPVFPHRTTPVLVRWILAVGNLQFNHAGDAAQLHWAQAPMDQLLAAEGEKPRHGARLLLAAVAGAAGESTLGPQLALPFRSPAAFVVASGPSSSFSFGCAAALATTPATLDHHYGGSV